MGIPEREKHRLDQDCETTRNREVWGREKKNGDEGELWIYHV